MKQRKKGVHDDHEVLDKLSERDGFAWFGILAYVRDGDMDKIPSIYIDWNR